MDTRDPLSFCLHHSAIAAASSKKAVYLNSEHEIGEMPLGLVSDDCPSAFPLSFPHSTSRIPHPCQVLISCSRTESFFAQDRFGPRHMLGQQWWIGRSCVVDGAAAIGASAVGQVEHVLKVEWHLRFRFAQGDRDARQRVAEREREKLMSKSRAALPRSGKSDGIDMLQGHLWLAMPWQMMVWSSRGGMLLGVIRFRKSNPAERVGEVPGKVFAIQWLNASLTPASRAKRVEHLARKCV